MNKTRDPLFQILTIAVPKDTQWEPHRALELTKLLMGAADYINLLITATDGRIMWSIEVPKHSLGAVSNAISSLYSQAEFNQRPKTTAHIGYAIYHTHAALPYCWPIKTVDEFQKLDPLAAIAGALANVQSGEELVYELALSPPEQDYYTLCEKLYNSTATGMVLGAIADGIGADSDAKRSQRRRERQRDQQALREQATEKVKAALGMLKEVVFGYKIKANSQERVKELADLVDAALRQYDCDTNILVLPTKETFPLVFSPAEVAALWHLPTESSHHRRIVWAKSIPTVLFQPPSATEETEYVVLGNTEYLGQPQPIYLAYDDRKTHINIVGKNGTGKSTLIHSLVRQDMLNGKTVGVIDPKGDLINWVLANIPSHREKDVVLFDVADKAHPIGLNLLAMPPGVSPDDVAGRILALIKKFFADDWPGEQTEGAFYAAILTLLYTPGSTIMDISRLFNDDDYRKQVLSQVDDPGAFEFWDDYKRRSPGDRQRVASPVVTRARKFYRDRTLGRIICQSRGLNFRWLIDANKIFLASLTGVGEIEAHTLGALLITKFQLAVMSRTDIPEQQRQPVYLYIDEVQNFATYSLGTMFSQGRSFGLNLATANQYFSQLPGETLEAVLGNVGTNICFAVGENSARHLAGLMRPQFTTDDLQQLDKYTAAVKMQKEGQTLPAFLLHTLLPLVLPDATTTIDRIRQHSRQTYGRPASEVDAELRRRYDPGEPDQPSPAPAPTGPTEPHPTTPAASSLRGDVDLGEIWE